MNKWEPFTPGQIARVEAAFKASLESGIAPITVEQFIAELTANECTHEKVTPSYEHVTCQSCGKIKTGNHSDTWGIAAGKWFKSLLEADFYKKHGRLPE